ncbi:MAG TPA: pitrilysin family protein [Patescibacteria group bacterium]|nr:pitrilysin family protein [Patescibacteria group bacterium]
MDFRKKILPNGLTLLTVPMPGLESVTVTVWVKTGSRNEDGKVGGISHFLEHMVFKGSKKRPSAKAISETVDAIGGEFNAGTSKDWTNFYIKTRVGNIETAMDVLSDMVLDPILDATEIEREKGTIIQEIAMYEDTPMMHIPDVFEEVIFEGNPLGWDTAGTAKTVKTIKRSDFLAYRDIHYHPEQMMVSVVGGIDEKKSLSLVEKYFSSLKPFKGNVFKGQEFVSKQTKPQFKLQTKKSEQVHLILGFMSEGRGYSGRFAQSVLATILGGGMSSRMFTEVRERRGLAYSIQTGMSRYQEVGYLSTYAGVDVAKADQAIAVILEQYQKLADGKLPVSLTELKKAKEFLKGHLALALEDTKDVTHFFADQALFTKDILTPEEVYKKVDKVSVEDVLKEAKKLFTKDRLNLAMIGPYTNKGRFEKLLM